MTDETAQLVAALDRCRERLHALPDVVGTGVGLRDDRPVVQIFVAGGGGAEAEAAVREVADFDFELVPDSRPADAETQHANPEE